MSAYLAVGLVQLAVEEEVREKAEEKGDGEREREVEEGRKE